MSSFPIGVENDTDRHAALPTLTPPPKPQDVLRRPLNGANPDEPSTAGSYPRSQSGARHYVAAGVALQVALFLFSTQAVDTCSWPTTFFTIVGGNICSLMAI